MLVEAFDEHFDSGLYTLMCHLLELMMDDRERFDTLSVFYNSPYEDRIVHIMQRYKRTLQRRRARMIETVDVIERSYKRAPPYGTKKDNGKLRRSDKGLARIKMRGPYVARQKISIAINEKARAADVGDRRSFTASFASGLVNIFSAKTIKTFLTFVRKVAAA